MVWAYEREVVSVLGGVAAGAAGVWGLAYVVKPVPHRAFVAAKPGVGRHGGPVPFGSVVAEALMVFLIISAEEGLDLGLYGGSGWVSVA